MTESQTQVRPERRFAFGRNWRSFIRLVDEPRITGATRSLLKALDTSELAGRTFLDVGCGSGLFSLAAHRLGARVRSFDFDPESVAATMELRTRFAPDSDWTIEQGSALDEAFLHSLGRFDVVYSWGVLHHTGDMWRAMRAVSGLVAPAGHLYISIYNDQGLQSRAWRRVKLRYNTSGPLVRSLLVAGSVAYLGRRAPLHGLVRLLRDPRARAGSRPARARGMSARHDLIDWVGGYPFEVAKPEEVLDFLQPLGFRLRRLTTCAGGLGCNEYVFEREGDVS